MDLYLPDGKNFPTLMFISGGGWVQSSKAWVSEVGYALREHGIAVAIPDHRLQPQFSLADQLGDLDAAFRWVSENIADHGGDPDQILIGGHSAGGHLAALLAVSPGALQPALVSAALDTGNRFGPDSSPLDMIVPGLADCLLLYADGDYPTQPEQAELFAADMGAEGNTATVIEIDERDHFNILHHFGSPGDPASAAVIDWINTQTRD